MTNALTSVPTRAAYAVGLASRGEVTPLLKPDFPSYFRCFSPSPRDIALRARSGAESARVHRIRSFSCGESNVAIV